MVAGATTSTLPRKCVISTDQREWRDLSISQVPVVAPLACNRNNFATAGRHPGKAIQRVLLAALVVEAPVNAEVSPLPVVGRNDKFGVEGLYVQMQ